MILSDTAIRDAIANGDIVIEPFDPTALGGNSYDVRLSQWLRVYEPTERWFGSGGGQPVLDAKVDNPTREVVIDDRGMVLVPGQLYLASTVEYTETHAHVPYLDGRSSVGRLGISIHETAGRGDVGFCGHWTMEVTVVHPVRVYAGMRVGQLTFHTVEGRVSDASVYSRKAGNTYGTSQRDPRPVPSGMWRSMKARP
jgi:dCTP deaminase